MNAPDDLRWEGGDGGRYDPHAVRPPDHDPRRAAAHALPGEEWDPDEAGRRQRREAERATLQQARNHRGERMLRDVLQRARQEGAAKAVGKRFLAAVDHVGRRARAHGDPALAAVTARSGLRPEDVPLDAEIDGGADPREQEETFRRATPEEQQRLRARWEQEAARRADDAARARRRLGLAVWEGLVVWSLTAVLVLLVMPVVVAPLMMALGPVAGMLWHATRAGRLQHALISVALYIPSVGGLTLAVMGGDVFAAFPLIGYFYGGMFLAYTSSWRGLRAEMRVLEGARPPL